MADESPTSRLSQRITKYPLLASRVQNSSDQKIPDVANPIIKRIGRWEGSPKDYVHKRMFPDFTKSSDVFI